MRLPCPHCKKSFSLSPDRIPAGATKLRCPACKGHFIVDTSPLRRVTEPAQGTFSPGPSSDGPPTKAPPPPPSEGNGTAPKASSRKYRLPPTLWLLLPASALLVALVGILVPVVWKTPAPPARQTAQDGPSASCALRLPTSDTAEKQISGDKPSERAKQDKGLPAEGRQPFTYRSMYPFSPTGKQECCEHLAGLDERERGTKAEGRSDFYAPWIAYLSLETSSSPACDLDTPFRIATQGIAKHELCGRGYAFLSAYYSYKRVPDRSRSFLEEALQASPKDPWVKLVEAVIYERDMYNHEKAARVLKGLLRKEPSFALARYHLGRIYIEDEEYGKAKELYLLLAKAFPEQPEFMRIQQSLAHIEQVPYYSLERAKGLLKVSRALSDLTDYPLAGRLCRKVLEDMPGTLPNAEKKSAFYDLGRISELTGDTETAFTCYQNALRIDPFYRDARERMGSILKGDA